MKTLILNVTAAGESVASAIAGELREAEVKMLREWDRTLPQGCDSIVFVGALGICVRSIAHLIRDKYTDPAVVCVDSTGRFAIAVLSGHVGGANALAAQVAHITGATPVVTTRSDNEGLWALDTLGREFGWTAEAGRVEMNKIIFSFVNGKKTALVLDIKDRGTEYLRRTLPPHVTISDGISGIGADTELVIAVTPFVYDTELPVLYYRPRVLELGLGCRKDYPADGVYDRISASLLQHRISPLSVRGIATIELKKDEPLLADLAERFGTEETRIFTAAELKDIEVPNPSEKVHEVTGVWGVAESAAMAAAASDSLVLEKQKGEGFTFAVAMDREFVPGKGHVEIVGAGPGDPELVSVRGKRFLQEADLILYAGSLVPRELTFYAKEGCMVRSSASMTLEEQFSLMKEFYDRGQLVVRLHTGDPCIYGAIQEQMACFDRYGMSYHITPGISSFQAAAAALRSQFTIPEKVQTIILTRGEGRTPMPDREKLSKLAQSRSTMCIYLSAGVVDDVQSQLLEAYPPETPVAACYKLTWKDERIYRGQLRDLARIVHDNNLTLTTLLVVGDAIDNREGLSKLYGADFKHLFRP